MVCIGSGSVALHFKKRTIILEVWLVAHPLQGYEHPMEEGVLFYHPSTLHGNFIFLRICLSMYFIKRKVEYNIQDHS
jgi:hypothetical protein